MDSSERGSERRPAPIFPSICVISSSLHYTAARDLRSARPSPLMVYSPFPSFLRTHRHARFSFRTERTPYRDLQNMSRSNTGIRDTGTQMRSRDWGLEESAICARNLKKLDLKRSGRLCSNKPWKRYHIVVASKLQTVCRIDVRPPLRVHGTQPCHSTLVHSISLKPPIILIDELWTCSLVCSVHYVFHISPIDQYIIWQYPREKNTAPRGYSA